MNYSEGVIMVITVEQDEIFKIIKDAIQNHFNITEDLKLLFEIDDSSGNLSIVAQSGYILR